MKTISHEPVDEWCNDGGGYWGMLNDCLLMRERVGEMSW